MQIIVGSGYALLRSAVARAIMDAGLLPTVGIFHCNYYNSFPLADDLMEPYRPFIDEKVYEIYQSGKREIDREFKRMMVEVLYEKVSQEERIHKSLYLRYCSTLNNAQTHKLRVQNMLLKNSKVSIFIIGDKQAEFAYLYWGPKSSKNDEILFKTPDLIEFF